MQQQALTPGLNVCPSLGRQREVNKRRGAVGKPRPQDALERLICQLARQTSEQEAHSKQQREATGAEDAPKELRVLRPSHNWNLITRQELSQQRGATNQVFGDTCVPRILS